MESAQAIAIVLAVVAGIIYLTVLTQSPWMQLLLAFSFHLGLYTAALFGYWHLKKFKPYRLQTDRLTHSLLPAMYQELKK